MFKLTGRLIRASLFQFCGISDSRDRQLTKIITSSTTTDHLITIVTKNSGQLNIVHISAVLRKLNMKMVRDKSILDLVYKEVKKCIQQNNEPNLENARALANIVGYTGNRDYRELNQQLQKINYKKLFKLVNHKEFVMLMTGLLKLQLIQSTIGVENLELIIDPFIEDCKNLGLLTSLWRNLLKANKCTQKMNDKLLKRIVSFIAVVNLKDLGYLVYCYTQSPYIKQQNQQLSKFITRCSQNVLYNTRINVFELCIFLDHLAKLNKFGYKQPNSDFIFILKSHYLRIIKLNIDFRSLANSYMSIFNFKNVIDSQVFEKTASKFVDFIKNEEQVEDYQSVTSLFLHLMTTESENANKLQILEDISQRIKDLFFKNNSKLHQISDKQLQKLFYSFYLCKKEGIAFNFSSEDVELILKSLSIRDMLSQIQINSIVASLSALNIRDQAICRLLKEKFGASLENLKRTQCSMGFKSDSCLKCLKEPKSSELI